MDDPYDVIVLGVGGMGSAALYHLAQRGVRACGIERFGIAHDRGSSHGDTRIIRKAYMEHPDYVPLLHRAYDLWEELEEETGRELFLRTGLLLSGPPESEVMRGLAACYEEHNLPHEELDAEELRRRYSQLRLPADWSASFDPLGGILRVEECVRQQVAMAQRHGATLFAGEEVRSWKAEGEGVVVETERRRLSAGCMILTAGAWAVPALGELGVEMKVLRKLLFWYGGQGVEEYRREVFPCFCIGVGSGSELIYGFPAIDEWGLKITEHNISHKEILDPLKVNRQLEDDDESQVLQILERFFPRLKPERSKFVTCLYTMSPDENFIIDRHPEHKSVVIGAGFSGHGFKFASVVGEILADLALEGETKQPIDFLRIGRLLE